MLHRRLSTALALFAILAFVSGAGLGARSLVPTTALLLASLFWFPGERVRRAVELLWRTLAVLFAARAGYHALFVGDDVVLPMVDLLLMLLLAETFRAQEGMGEARIYALTFALLIAATAYRPGSLFALAFTGYLAVLTVALIAGQLARHARSRGHRPPALTRGFVLQSAALSGVVLFVSVLVFVAFPRVSWAARAGVPLRNLAGFGDRVTLLEHGDRIYDNPAVVLRVEFPGRSRPPAGPLYWRGRSYDRFDGWTWSRASYRPQAIIDQRGWPDARVEQVIYQSGIDDANVLFGLAPALQLTPRSRITTYTEPNGDFTYGGPAAPVYAVVSVLGEPPADALRAAGTAPDRDSLATPEQRRAAELEEWALRPYLRLPILSPEFYSLADSLARPYHTDYDRALAVRDWLQHQFRYTLELPRTEREASLEFFLFHRRAGHCEYFSTAMAMLLRAMDIPARNVNGFLGGEWNGFGNFLTVTQNQAHSWVEAWFPGYGWVTFDPTPSAKQGARGSGEGVGWLGPLGLLFGGLEHRWGKWVLDYDLGAQGRLLNRAVGGFRAATSPPASAWQLPWPRVLASAFALLLLGLGVSTLVRRRRQFGVSRRRSTVTRDYLRLRRAYARAGYAPPAPPLTFLAHLQQAQAPGAAEAAAAITLYARLRFGPRPAGSSERRQLHQAVSAARRLLRRGQPPR